MECFRLKVGRGDVKHAEGRCKCGQGMNLGVFRSQIWCYWDVLTRYRKSVRRKTPELWPDKWIFHHDHAPVHDALRVCEFLAKKSTTKMDHPSYSPDLAPREFWFFPKIKKKYMP
jgi:hypothetical protein